MCEHVHACVCARACVCMCVSSIHLSPAVVKRVQDLEPDASLGVLTVSALDSTLDKFLYPNLAPQSLLRQNDSSGTFLAGLSVRVP